MVPRVLLVDDSALARLAVARPLVALGIEIVERDSVAAVTSAPPSAVSCALLDLELPDGEGTAIAAYLVERTPGLPVAFFTGGASAAALERARALGLVFAKPSELDAAVAWIRRVTLGT